MRVRELHCLRSYVAYYNIHASMQNDNHVKLVGHYRMHVKRDICIRHYIVFAVICFHTCCATCRASRGRRYFVTTSHAFSAALTTLVPAQPIPTTGKVASELLLPLLLFSLR